jgi:hypothetical protein
MRSLDIGVLQVRPAVMKCARGALEYAQRWTSIVLATSIALDATVAIWYIHSYTLVEQKHSYKAEWLIVDVIN